MASVNHSPVRNKKTTTALLGRPSMQAQTPTQAQTTHRLLSMGRRVQTAGAFCSQNINALQKRTSQVIESLI